MRLGTARPGKSCIAWAEAVFLKSPRQRLTRDASKTVGRWVIPPPTLRAIVSTNFRSELLDVARDYERLAERADPRLVGEQKRSHEARLNVCSKPRRSGSLLVEAIRCPSIPSSCDCSLNRCICSWACRDHSSNASVGPFTRANSSTKFKPAITLAWPKSINLALKSRKPSPAEEKPCSASLAACSTVAVPFSKASRAALAPPSNDFLAGLFSAMCISRWNLAQTSQATAERFRSKRRPFALCGRTRSPGDRSAVTANSNASASRARLTRGPVEFRRTKRVLGPGWRCRSFCSAPQRELADRPFDVELDPGHLGEQIDVGDADRTAAEIKIRGHQIKGLQQHTDVFENQRISERRVFPRNPAESRRDGDQDLRRRFDTHSGCGGDQRRIKRVGGNIDRHEPMGVSVVVIKTARQSLAHIDGQIEFELVARPRRRIGPRRVVGFAATV